MASLNSTPSSERVHIGFFGRRNAGKSSLVNRVTNQELAVVSDTPGTTTDPVTKSMELLPLGPVVIIDTPGFDDEGELGLMRVRRTAQVLNRTDIAVLVTDITKPLGECEKELVSLFEQKKIPYILVGNKCDLADKAPDGERFAVSAAQGKNIHELRERIASLVSTSDQTHRIVGDIVKENEFAVLVVPIDKAAPKGRLILPQQMVIRDLLESGSVPVVCRETELEATLAGIGTKPSVVITDSQAFGFVSKTVPQDIRLTSFSILMAKYKGFLETSVKGAKAIHELKDGDKVLISEGCTHHRQCGDIGSVKLPALLKKTTGKDIEIVLTSGREFPEELSEYALCIHCGGCMLTEREMLYRMRTAIDQGLPFTNYGVAISLMNGILARSLSVFPEIQKMITD
ncbi:[FeFe] hydrogenase H-cluster maturation GTPase HydF [Ruminococcus sp. NK3A76]|uniref:[FeFe] hydrogenase H-cluster maturation GTPase HydF n=1 Tax=Ruminococcus sp. NK3A76 TaxID=877411 RepID=UPI0005647553|nr:[FeFe] hydrogenase H-cluster maturation GTPase HydF [Ruminococcus sp. NK3A76]